MRKNVWRIVAGAAAAAAALVAGLQLLPRPHGPAAPANAAVESFHQIAKWDVRYDDSVLGRVNGIAFCRWPTSQDKPSSDHGCRVRLRNPKTLKLDELLAWGYDITFPSSASPWLTMTLTGNSPSGERVAYPASGTQAAAGSEGTISIKNGDVTTTYRAPVMQTAPADTTVLLRLLPRSDGTLTGTWSYFADPITQRDANGAGRAGLFRTLKDDAAPDGLPAKTGGFRSIQTASETWTPLPPRVYKVEVLEDQAGYDGPAPKYPRSKAEPLKVVAHGDPNHQRTLVVFGSDLPVWNGKDYAGITSKDEGFEYDVVADSRAPDITQESRDRIERAFGNVTAGWLPDDAAAFRKLDAAVVIAYNSGADPGLKTFVWGTTEGRWLLQYGDNTAALRFMRITGQEHPSPDGALKGVLRQKARQDLPPGQVVNTEDTEQVTELVLPDRVVAEVETGTELIADTIPVVVGGPALAGQTVSLVASRTRDERRLYRTGPLVFVDKGAGTPNFAGRATVIPVAKGRRVFVKADDAKTTFLRATLGAAGTGLPGTLFVSHLARAEACVGLSSPAPEVNWEVVAKTAMPLVTVLGVDVDVTFGDHAAMLLVRDVFVESLKRHLSELQKIDAETTSPKESDQLIDSWYRNMYALVAGAPEAALAQFTVTGPAGGGRVPFLNAYSNSFEESTFHTSTSADGATKFREWRRRASREALRYYRSTISDAIAEVEHIADCNIRELLTRTSGLKSIVARVLPLLMKAKDPLGLTEPDFVARGYVKNFDSVAERLASVQALGKAKRDVAISLVTIATPFIPIAWGAVGTGGEAISEFIFNVGGIAMFSESAASQLYLTYQEHEEVTFALAVSGAVGLDKYFDAASRSTPWWQTVARICGEGVLTGLGIRQVREPALAPLERGLSWWRGTRAAAKLLSGESATLGNLTAQEQYDFAAMELVEEEALAERSIASPASRAADRILRRLDSAPQAAEIEAVERQADAAALQRAAGADPAAPELASAEVRSAGANLAEQAEITQFEQEAEIGRELAARPLPEPKPGEIPPQLKPEQTERGMPVTLGHWEPSLSGRAAMNKIVFDIDGFLGQGEFQFVYRLKDVPKNLPMPLKPGLQRALREGRKLAVKVFRYPDRVTLGDKLARDADIAFDHMRFDGPQRMKHAEELIGVDQAIPHAEFQVFEEEGFVLQELVDTSNPKVVMFNDKRFGDAAFFRQTVPDTQRVAIARLAQKFWQRGLRIHDLHIKNIYLVQEGDEFIAKVLDPDFIERFGDASPPGIGDFHQYTKALASWNSDIKDPGVKNAMEAQMKSLEYKGLLTFDYQKGIYAAGYLDPSDFNHILPGDWPFLPANTPGPAKP